MKQTVNVDVDRGDKYVCEIHTNYRVNYFCCPVTQKLFSFNADDPAYKAAARAAQIACTRAAVKRAAPFFKEDIEARLQAIEAEVERLLTQQSNT